MCLQRPLAPCSLLAFSTLYVFKQTFAVPGSFVLNVAAGAVFGTTFGNPWVASLPSPHTQHGAGSRDGVPLMA